MTLEEFRKKSHAGHCVACNNTTQVMGWKDAIHTRPGEVIDLCFICTNTPSACYVHDSVRPVLAAVSVLLDVLKPKSKPRAPRGPRQPKVPAVPLQMMTPRRKH